MYSLSERRSVMKDYKKVEAKIRKKVAPSIECSERYGSIRLEGEVNEWSDVIKAGFIAAKSEYREVINDISLPNDFRNKFSLPKVKSDELAGKKIDVLIIGGGVIGCAIARELSRYDLKTLLIEKEYDVAVHTSSRNDGMIHPGFAAPLGSLKSKFNVKGNAMFEKVATELGNPYKKTGSHILCGKDIPKEVFYPVFKAKAEMAGIPDSGYVGRKELERRIPHIAEDIRWAYYFPSTKITAPYKMTVAFAENAITNGVEFSLETVAMGMEKDGKNILSVKTNKGRVYPKLVINAAGVCTDLVAAMAGDRFYSIHPRKGEIALLDRKKADYLTTVASKPILTKSKKEHSKGGGLVSTVEGNILVGPNAMEVQGREDYLTNMDSLNAMLDRHLATIDGIDKSDVITYFAGTRAATYKEDFIIERSRRVPNLIHVAGIQSPGFASSASISDYVRKLAVKYLLSVMEVKKNPKFNPIRKKPYELRDFDPIKRAEIIRKNPDYGTIICRCEEISKGEIEDALNSPLEVKSIDAIKRRTRSTMGRCQGGFCTPHIMRIIEEVKEIDAKDINKKGRGSNVIYKRTKGESNV